MSKAKKGLQAVATLEASKGVLSLIVGLGLHMLAGENLHLIISDLVAHLHLNPANYVTHMLLQESQSISSSNITLVEIGAFAYAAIRFIEAYGLWHGMVWTEWFAFISGTIYLPFEIYEMIVNFNVLSVGVFAINVAVVWYMYTILKSQREHHKQALNETQVSEE